MKLSEKEKLIRLKQYLNEINKNLPACVYIPFIKGLSSINIYLLMYVLLDYLRNSAVLHIVVEESKVFSTKERAPYYICIELYRPQEYYLHTNL